MAKLIQMDEIHLTIHVPNGLPAAEYSAIRRSMRAARFLARLERACRDVIKQFPVLHKVRITLAR